MEERYGWDVDGVSGAAASKVSVIFIDENIKAARQNKVLHGTFSPINSG